MSNSRIKFLRGEQKEFIENIYKNSGLATVDLAKIADVHPRSFRDWRREKLTMRLSAARLFCKMFGVVLPERQNDLINRWNRAKYEASKKGGTALFQKHGSPATLEGRRKGGVTASRNLRKNGFRSRFKHYSVTKTYSEELAEFIGIMLGDGGITSGQLSITLNSIADMFYIDFVSDLALKLFGEKPKAFNKKDCAAVVLYYNSILLVQYCVSIGLRVGNKVKQQVEVPEWILMNNNYKVACLRGLIDTDGGIFRHVYRVNGKEYHYNKLCFANRSLPLITFVANTLGEIGLTPKVDEKLETKRVWLYNHAEASRYLQIVGTHNKRLLKWGG